MNLLALAFGAVALLLILILVFRLHAFLALLLSSFAMGLAAGMKPVAVLKSIQAGFGDALGFIAVVLRAGSDDRGLSGTLRAARSHSPIG